MKIFYDGQAFQLQNYGGVSNYYCKLIAGVLEKKHKICLSVTNIENEYLRNSVNLVSYLNENCCRCFSGKGWLLNIDFKGKKRILTMLEKIGIVKSVEKLSINMLKKESFDVFHPTYYNPYFMKHIGQKPVVVTVYDMVHELFPDLFKGNDLTIKKRAVVDKADVVIAISNTTKKDLVRFFNVPEEKVKVIHLATSINETGSVNVKHKIPNRYILYTGLRWGYKNFEYFIKACIPIIKEKKIAVVCTANTFTKTERKLFDDFGINDKIIHINANEGMLSYLYRNAIAFVFPSKYEGFGIPILEAFTCECPVIASNRGAIPEIGEDAVEYFDPYSVENMTNAITMVIENEEKRKEMVIKGLKVKTKYSWNRMVCQTIEVYENVLRDHRKEIIQKNWMDK